ncbi:hypothetical protein DNTS_015360 [Danionella cerebrum]|uniref:Uncharacterized protein n=1 Tax=Danionella cerebrum TaxID=2873325 RepID=A0A553NWU7_9TELE|nr:hypothetical protein DNTS_015360 [Danionella translucida]
MSELFSFQNLHQCEQEKPTPTPEENLESRITASPSLLQLKDQWKSCKDTPEHALSLDGISKSKADVKNSSSSLMDKGYFESPSPAAIRKSTNVDWQNKTTKQNRTPLENQLSAGQEKKDADENGNLSYYGDFSHRRLKDQGNGQLPQLEHTGDHLEDDFKDPTPPLSPSLSPRRISQARAISSPIRPTPENLSPLHGVLPPRNYITSVLDESGSDTTTDDEYYLGNGDDGDLETEL